MKADGVEKFLCAARFRLRGAAGEANSIGRGTEAL